MKKLCILLILVSLIYLPGCVVIHSKADTILTLSPDTKNGEKPEGDTSPVTRGGLRRKGLSQEDTARADRHGETWMG